MVNCFIAADHFRSEGEAAFTQKKQTNKQEGLAAAKIETACELVEVKAANSLCTAEELEPYGDYEWQTCTQVCKRQVVDLGPLILPTERVIIFPNTRKRSRARERS